MAAAARCSQLQPLLSRTDVEYVRLHVSLRFPLLSSSLVLEIIQGNCRAMKIGSKLVRALQLIGEM